MLILQFLCCLADALMLVYWNFNSSSLSKAYAPEIHSLKVEGVLQFFRYFILLNTLLPISLFVSLEIIKTF